MRARVIAVLAAGLVAGCGGSGVPAAVHTATSPSTPAGSGQAPGGPRNGAPCKPSAGVAPGTFFGYEGSNPLRAVQFVSPERGWVAGRHVLLATTDGGASWTVQRRGELDLVSVDFISADTGWAVGLDSLLSTSNGGRTWTALPEPCGVIRSVHFLSPRDGYAIAGGIDPVSDGVLAPASGGAVVRTTDGGRSWQPVAAPADPQTVCFSGGNSGWLGAAGKLYFSADGGQSWRLQAAGPHGSGAPAAPGVMFVQCASGSVWALDVGPGAASSQQPHIGYHASPAGAVPLFAEQYFPHPGVRVRAEAPSAYAGPVSAISSSAAAFIDWCDVCGYGTAPWVLAADDGARLDRAGTVGGLNQALGASFLSPSLGWVVGTWRSGAQISSRIVSTADGGRSWRVQYPAG